jgi:filamentous hemagglutinin family protein
MRANPTEDLLPKEPAMPIRTSVTRSLLASSRHGALLATVSALALFVAGPEASAKPLGAGSAPPVVTAPAVAPEAGQAALQAQAAMKRSIEAIQAMQAAQRAARDAAAAAASNIPNGLQTGGLEVKAGAVPGSQLWQGANGPTQKIEAGRTKVGIEQTQAKAILTWETFNIGKDTDLTFDQKGNRDWIALNRVLDPSMAPSRILGNLKADGQVYVINGNGIIFGAGSQVNVNTLVASSLSLSNEQFMAGINTQLFLRPGVSVTLKPQFGEYTSADPDTYNTTVETSAPWFTPSYIPGDVKVEKGAELAASNGGKLMLFAPKVTNAGTLVAPDGQIIMAAGENVWLSSIPANTPPGSIPYWSSPVRGFDVAVSAVPAIALGYYDMATAAGIFNPSENTVKFTDGLKSVIMPMMAARAEQVGYQVTNTGHIEAQRGDITLAGPKIVQGGVLLATSALNNREGSIRLQGWGQGIFGLDQNAMLTTIYWDSGSVTLNEGSVTAVMPDFADTSELELGALETRYRPGRVVIRGEQIDIQTDASLVVPAGEISILATSTPVGALPDKPASSDDSLHDGSRIYIDTGAYVSAAGLQDVLLPMDINFVEATLGINELRDSPLYKDSWLRGLKVVVDRRLGGKFTTGPMGGVTWLGDDKEGEWVGTPLADVSAWVALSKTNIKELSTIGGTISLKAGGSIITREGSLLDVSGGSVRYEGGWNHTTKLVTANGQIIDISDALPGMSLVALANGFTRHNEHWGVTQTWVNPLSKEAGRFEPGYSEGREGGAITIFAGGAFILEGGIWAGSTIGTREIASPVTTNRGGSLTLGGADNVEHPFSPGHVIITDTPTRLAEDFTATSDVDDIFFHADDREHYEKTSWISAEMLSQSGIGDLVFNVHTGLTLEEGAMLRLDPGASLRVAPAAINAQVDVVINGTIRAPGGSITVATDASTRLGAGALIDVSGEWVNAYKDGVSRAFAIHGGSINLLNLVQTAPGAVLDVSGGGYVSATSKVSVGDAGAVDLRRLANDGILGNLDLRAYAAGSGGSLILQVDAPVEIGEAPGAPGAFHLAEDLFADRGFRSITIVANGGVTVAENAEISLTPVGIRLGPDVLSQSSGQHITDVGTIEVLRIEERLDRAPTSLTLTGGDILIGHGANLSVDIGGSVLLGMSSGSGFDPVGNVTILGTIDAPAGSIVVNADGTIRLADGGSLLARGVPAIYRGKNGNRTGKVLAGGTVSLVGNILLEGGSLIDVSGAQGDVDLPLGGPRTAQFTVASDGGVIDLTGHSVVRGALRAYAGGAGAKGGTLRLSGGSGELESFDLLKNTMFLFAQAAGKTSWEDAIGMDFGYFFGAGGSFIFTQELVDAFSGIPGAGDIHVTGTGLPAGGGGGLNASDWFSEAHLDELPGFGPEFDLRPIFGATANGGQPSLLLTSAFENGGFGQLALEAMSGKVMLDGVTLNLSRSISIAGTIFNPNGMSSTLIAPHVTLSVDGNAAAPLRAGTLTVDATLLDINFGGRIRGFENTILSAVDVRLADHIEAPGVSLDVDGHLTLRAGQVYPATGARATIRASDSITIERNGETGLPLSAGGSLTLEAPVIEQNGVLRAPFGSITLKAGDRVTVGDGSITSVSGVGLVLPYGQLLNDEFWTDPTKVQDVEMVDLTAPPEKRITLDAPNVDVAEGSVLDVRGGGDLFAWEFVAGTGGSHDVLTMPGAFAIMPENAASFGQGTDGKRIWLAGGNGLAAGWYTVLPARYAMLPGAYAILPGNTSWSAQPASGGRLSDGSLIMAGYMGDAFSSARDPGYTSWQVMSGDVLRTYSEYNEAFASEFFSSESFALTQYRRTGLTIAVPRLPQDAGAVVLKAAQSLMLVGELKMQAAEGGRGGLLDVAASKIAVVGAGQSSADYAADGYLVIDSTMLTNAGAGSLLIGGVRSGNALGLNVDVIATDIVVENSEDTRLAGLEIILAASDRVTMRAGSVVAAEGEATEGSVDLVMTPESPAVYTDPDGWEDDNYDGVIDAKDAKDDVLTSPVRDWGALIRVSNAGDARILRDVVDMSQGGEAVLEEGTVLRGGKSLTIDATRSTTLAASALVSGKNLTLGGGRIGFGGGSDGLVFDERALQQLSATENLRLRSYSTIDFHRTVDFGGAGIGKVTLDAAAFVGVNGDDVTLRADTLVLDNTASTATVGGDIGTGTFTLQANEIVLGSGAKSVGGFAQVHLIGGKRVLGSGNGSLDTGAADLRIDTPLLTANDGAAQSLLTSGALVLTGSDGAATNAAGGYGARLSLTGGSVSADGRIVALSGAVNLTATSGDVVLGSHALVDVGGFAKQFFDVSEYADAGTIGLTAIGGSVRMDTEASLNLSAHAGGGNAGTLSATAEGALTTVGLDGRITAKAGAGGKGGSFALEVDLLSDFAGLSETLNEAGFFAARKFRIRNGDVVVDGATKVAEFSLAADRGIVTLRGSIDARTTYGGRITVSGGNGVIMESSAVLKAGATDTKIGSGRVTLEAAGGTLDIRGGTIDVSGGEGGKVRFRALQTVGHDGVAVTDLSATIAGARSAVLEGVSVYQAGGGSTFDGTTVDSVKAEAILDAGTFESHAGAIASDLGIAVMAGIEIRADGDLALNSDWDLLVDFAGQREGTLTLRAGGNLDINGSVSDGFDTAGLLDAGKSWDLRLVAGADLASADALALTPLPGLDAGKGTLTLGTSGAGKLVRTGTGDVDVRAGRDLVLADKTSAIYSAGRRDTTDYADFITPTDVADAAKTAIYGIEGGSVRLTAQGSVHAQPTGQRFTEWLRRVGASNWETGLFADYSDQWGGQYNGQQSSWWIDYGQFLGIGALGGGNLAIEAGGDLDNVVAVLPTNARMRGGLVAGQASVLEMRNGGAFDIRAGGAIKAGYYYIGRGAGTILGGEMTVGRTTIYTNPNTGLTTAYDIAPILGLGDATLDVRIQGDLRLETVVDPLLLAMDRWEGQYDDPGLYMSGHTNRTALHIVSVGGDLTIVDKDAEGDFIFRDVDGSVIQNPKGIGINRYPALTRIAALNGSIILNGPIYTMTTSVFANADHVYTSAWNGGGGTITADFRLLAGHDLTFAAMKSDLAAVPLIVLSRATPEMIPSPFAPRSGFYDEATASLDIHLTNDILSAVGPRALFYRNPDVMTLTGDYEPSRIYALDGTLTGSGTLNLIANEQTFVRAGHDIRNIYFDLRNLHATDTSLVAADNDVIAGARDRAGIVISGPGQLLVTAGRDIFAPGGENSDAVPFTITSVGNQSYRSGNEADPNSRIAGLPDTGASVTLMAGLNGQEPDYAAFAAAYLDPANLAAMPDYLKTEIGGQSVPIYLTDLYETRPNGVVKLVRAGVTSFIKDMTDEDLSPAAAWARFQSLPKPAQQRFMREVYMQELRMATRDQLTPDADGQPQNGGYNRGYAAIAKLFPGDAWKGDILMADGSIRTMQGGDIDVLVPGGSLQLAALGQAPADGRGMITLGNPGDIRIFVDQNVFVNRSRVLTFGGGDEIVWATEGDVDAGRGAKTSRSFNRPLIVTDANGNTHVIEKADISGSGMGTVEGVSGVDPDVDIGAPRGTVNAGDAGIRVGGNLNLAALHVVNAGNIEVDGISKGVPKVEAPDIGGLTEASDASGAAAQQAALPQNTATEQPSIIIVEVLGFGGGDGDGPPNGEDEERKKRENAERRAQNPGSRVQVVGAGVMTDEQTMQLVAEKRAQIGR